MTRIDMKRETCSCRVCRSDLAYLVPCAKEIIHDAPRISEPVAEFHSSGVAASAVSS